ncbi:MAG: hypothetical protein M1837_006224 [Sclerophora amabilis]|nr:MAG: hypothetical protein M1837_006224 [Sclerophora amabilis]
MAMWITKQRATPGPVFGSTDKFEGLGIFIDTYKNNRPGVVFPYVMAMLGDGSKSYDQGNDGKANEIAGCSARGLRNAANPSRLRLTHFADGNLTLALQYRSADPDDWEPCFSMPSVKIPTVAYIGFSAETGELSENHDIIRVDTKNLYTVSAKNPSGKGKGDARGSGKGRGGSDSRKREGGGWGWFFIKFVLFLVACGAAYVGWTIFRAQQRSRGSRF